MRPQGDRNDPLTDLALRAGAVVAAFGVVTWATGQITARLASGRWMHLPASQMVAVVPRLMSHPGDPAHAFPKPARLLVPGPVAFWSVFVILGLVGALVIAGGLRLAKRVEDPKKKDGGARWATSKDLRPLRVRRTGGGRLALGRAAGSLIATETGHSVLVLGPTQSLKTTGLAIPAILEWDGPVIATSVKTDLVRETLGHRQGRGPVWIYDPTAATGLPTSGWNPLDSCETWQGALRMAADLVGAAEPEVRGSETEHWQGIAEKFLGPLLHAAAIVGLSMSDVMRWLDTKNQAEPRRILKSGEQRAALDAAAATFTREERERSGAYSTTEILLKAFSDPAVQESASRSEIRPEALTGDRLRREHTLYLCAPPHEQHRLRPLFACLLTRVIAAAYRDAARSPGGRLARPLLIVLDEAANIAPLRDLDSIATTASGHGVQLVSIFQDLAQIQARYHHRAGTITNNHRAKILMPGVSDPETLTLFSRLLGDRETPQWSESVGGDGRRTRTQGSVRRPLATTDALRMARPGEGVLVYGVLPPVRLRLRPWFRDQTLRRLAQTPVASTAARRTPRLEEVAEPTEPILVTALSDAPPGAPDVPTGADATLVSASEVARVLGITRQAVHSRWSRGTLPYVEETRDGATARRMSLAALGHAAGLAEDEVCARLTPR